MSIPEKIEFHMRLLEVILPLATYINMRIVIAKPGLPGQRRTLTRNGSDADAASVMSGKSRLSQLSDSARTLVSL